jgi:uncharacterized protein involved in exopolysaccharide biosynthesis
VAASKARNVPVGTGQTGGLRSTRRTRLNADTSAEPEGLTRRVVLNVLEAFFRRPWLHLLPLILMLILGGVSAFGKDSVYRSTGTITASPAASNLVSSLAQGNSQGFGFESQATVVARNINEQLRTTQFLDTIASKIQADPSNTAERALLRTVIAKDVTAVADGDSLVRVAATTGRPDLSLRLAQETINAYRAAVVDSQVEGSEQDVAFFKKQQDTAKSALDTANKDLLDFVSTNGITDATKVDLATQLALKQKQDEVGRLQTAYDAAVQQLNDANVKVNAARTAVDQQLRVTDPAEAPFAPEPKLKKAVLTVIIFGVLGLLLSLASVIISATLDRTIRVPGDITAKFDLDVLAVVPDARAR